MGGIPGSLALKADALPLRYRGSNSYGKQTYEGNSSYDGWLFGSSLFLFETGGRRRSPGYRRSVVAVVVIFIVK